MNEKWRVMVEAPKDGTPVLLMCAEGVGLLVTEVGSYRLLHSDSKYPGWWSEDDTPLFPYGWREIDITYSPSDANE